MRIRLLMLLITTCTFCRSLSCHECLTRNTVQQDPFLLVTGGGSCSTDGGERTVHAQGVS